MSCEQISQLLDSYLDGEFVDALRNREIEEHLATCAECRARLDALKHAVKAVQNKSSYYQAPQRLHDSIASMGVEKQALLAPSRDRLVLRWAFAACILLMAANLVVTITKSDHPKVASMESELVASHIRSLQAQHLFDVPSSDKHTVKPWFQGKISFSPEVPNLTSDGFPLLGGRLDYIAGQPAAALVYGRGKHAINVFVLPMTANVHSSGDTEEGGYHVTHWAEHGLDYWAVSDTDMGNLDQFGRVFRASTPSDGLRPLRAPF